MEEMRNEQWETKNLNKGEKLSFLNETFLVLFNSYVRYDALLLQKLQS